MKHTFTTNAHKRALSSVFALLLTLPLLAQHYLNNLYTEGHDLLLFSGIEQQYGNYYVTGVAGYNAGHYGKVFCGLLDSNFHFTNHVIPTVAGAAYAFTNSLTPLANGGIMLTGYNIAGGERLLLARISSNLDSVKTISSAIATLTYRGTKLLPCPDGRLYVTGLIDSSQFSNVFLNKYDASGNMLWQKQYGANCKAFAKGLVRLPNNNLLLGAIKTKTDSAQNTLDNTWLIEVDEAGNLIKQWTDTSNVSGVPEGLKVTADNNILYGVQLSDPPQSGYVAYHGTIVLRDTAFNKIWQYVDSSLGDNNAITDIELLPDGGIIACGQKLGYYTNGTIQAGWIIKLTATGNLVWSKVYSTGNSNYLQHYLTDVDILPDGSIVAVGDCINTYATPRQQGWILKVDSNGCENTNCITGIEIFAARNQYFKIYPNPTSDNIRLTFDGNLSGTTLTVFNIEGQSVLQTKLNGNDSIGVAHLQQGNYVAELSGKNVKATTSFVIKR